MKVGFYQFKPEYKKKKNNLERIVKVIKREKNIENSIIVLPELCTTGYLFSTKEELLSLSENIPGETTDIILDLCKEKKISIILGIAEKERKTCYNSAVFITPEGIKGVYRKLHLFYKEKEIFEPGNYPLEVFTYKNIKIGIMICFDWWFPEVARTLALKKAHIICHPANLVLPYCYDVMKARSLENKIYTITCNRIGEEKNNQEKLCFKGKSQIISPEGKVLIKASEDKEEIKIIDINIKEAENKNLTPYNNLFKDRREDFYFK